MLSASQAKWQVFPNTENGPLSDAAIDHATAGQDLVYSRPILEFMNGCLPLLRRATKPLGGTSSRKRVL